MKEIAFITFCFFGFFSCQDNKNSQKNTLGDFTVSDSVLVRLELIEDSVSGINSKSYLYPRGVKVEVKNFSSYDIFLPDFLPLSSNIKIYYEDDSVGYVDYTDTWSNNLMVIPEDYRYRKDSAFFANARILKHKEVVDSLLLSFGRKNELTSLRQYELEQTYKYFDLKTLLLKKDQTYQGVISLQPLMQQKGQYRISFEYSSSINPTVTYNFQPPNNLNGFRKWSGDVSSNKLLFVNQ